MGESAAANYQTVIAAITATLSEANLVQILAYAATTVVGLVLLWWAVRKVSRVIMGAFKKGKLRL